jgi:predicted XRE-type DNA-binding protein
MNKSNYERGSRNVFQDLGLPNAGEHLVKAQLVYKIDTILKDRGLKQVEAAKLFGIAQPDVSKLLRGEFRQFSVERLLRFLVALNHDVEIVIKPHRDTIIMGITQTTNLYRSLGTHTIFCPPTQGIVNSQAVRIVVRYLREHPDAPAVCATSRVLWRPAQSGQDRNQKGR